MLQNLLLFGFYVIIFCILVYSSKQEESSLWLKITTQNPKCVYYFGPFSHREEAMSHQQGYIEDLTSEGAVIEEIILQQDNPPYLTILGDAQDGSEG